MSAMKKPVIQFEVDYTQFLNPEGEINGELPPIAKEFEHLIELYRLMVRTRVFDTKAITLQRTGKLGTYASTLGQEAVGAGIGPAMRAEDVFCPYYRDYGAQFWRGVKMEEILLYWGGDERGSCYQEAEAKQDFPICVPIGSQTLHAVGIATAMKYRQEPRVAVTVVGDGGTSRGDFYEAINLAGIWHLPVVFVINNNQWAISVPRGQQTLAKTLAQKGIAAGIPCEQIDGNDIMAVRHVVQTAVERARENKGPSLIEAITYRMSDHTTADDAKRYRKMDELEKYKPEDPILRLNKYLTHQKVWDETKEKALQEEASKEVAKAVEIYLNTKPREPQTMFDHLYAELPDAYLSQYEEASKLKGTKEHG